MAKKDMKRYYKDKDKNEAKPVEELQGKVKSGKKKAKQSVEAASNFIGVTGSVNSPRDFSFGYTDNDLATENIANDLDLTAADMQDLRG